MLAFCLLTNSSQQVSHSQRVCAGRSDVLGCCCHRHVHFFSDVIGSFLPYTRKGTTSLISPAHLAPDQSLLYARSQEKRDVRSGGAVKKTSFQLLLPTAVSVKSCVPQVSLLGRETQDLDRPAQAADRERYSEVPCFALVILIPLIP